MRGGADGRLTRSLPARAGRKIAASWQDFRTDFPTEAIMAEPVILHVFSDYV